MRRLRKCFLDIAMARPAELSQLCGVEFRIRRFWRVNIVSAMTIGAGYSTGPLSSSDKIHLRMELVFQGSILVAREAIDRLYLLLVRNVLRIETCVARNAYEFSVCRFLENAATYVQRDLLPFPFHRQR